MIPMTEGPFLAVCGVLAAAGVDKTLHPETTAAALRVAGLPSRPWLVRLGALCELTVGTGAAITGSSILAVLVSLSYLAFAVFVVVALARRWPLSTCGCFAQVDTPPTVGHVLLNIGAAGVATLVAAIGDGTIWAALHSQAVESIPLLLISGSVAVLMFLSITTAARLSAIRKSLSGASP
jgi:hypothetical protein